MLENWKRAAAGLFALLFVTAALHGCAAAGLDAPVDTGETSAPVTSGDAENPDDGNRPNDAEAPGDETQPSDPEAPGDETEPGETLEVIEIQPDPLPIAPDPSTGPEAVVADAEQLRLYSMPSGWTAAFATDAGDFFLADNSGALTDGLAARGIAVDNLDLSGYDEAFFRENRLVVIPRAANSGSVRYQSSITVDDGTANISLIANMPEVGTSDMADWLVLVPLPLAEYDASLAVTVLGQSGGAQSGLVDK